MLNPQQMAAELLAAAAQAYGEGDLPAVAAFGRAAYQACPSAAACNLVGLAEFGRGDHAEAVAQLERAVALDPGNAEYPNNLGFVFHALGRYPEARSAFEKALAIDPAMSNAANNMGSILEKLGDDAAAIACYRRALEIDPAFVEARDNLMLACARVAPQWHFPMMADEPRNRAYAEVLARVAPGRRVLDIGSGSGLLAMMAAQAGAAHVSTCEMQPVIAGVAKTVIAANNLSGRIDVWAMKSDQVQVGRELLAPAEVLVTETFASGLLSEGVLPTVEDAHRRLLTPDAVVVPRRAVAMGYLIGGRIIEEHLFAGRWNGLDMSAFDLLAPIKLGMHLDRLPHVALSADFELFGFDLAGHQFPPERRTTQVEATTQGRCVGIAQWIHLDLDGRTTYDNRPTEGAGSNGWMHVVHRFARPVDVAPGDVVMLALSHNRTNIAVGLDEAAH
jgi:type II protein arginine methyltransferase